MINTDITIIGGGPVGIFTVFQAGMFGMKSVIIETLENVGGQCAALYPEKPIYDIPGHPKITAKDLIDNLIQQVEPFKPTYLLNNKAESIKQINGSDWQIKTDKGNIINTKALIIAVGNGLLGPNKLPLNNAKQFEGKSIFYFIGNKEKFRNTNVMICGGGDSAIDWAIVLSEVANKIYLLHRREKFRAFESSLNNMYKLVNEGRIELVVPYQINAINGEDGIIQTIEVVNLDGGKKVINASYLLPFYGLSMDLGPIVNWGIKLQGTHIAVDQSNMQTNLKNIYAVGDIASYINKQKLILSGFAEAVLAIHDAYKAVFPGKALHFEHSTTKGIPGF